MLKANHKKLSGNDKFEGFIVDLLEALKTHLNFTSFVILLGKKASLPDLPYTSDSNLIIAQNESNWSSIIDNLISSKADMAIGDLTITSDREKMVDFTIPFLTFSIGLLMIKSSSNGNNNWSSLDLFTFIKPFSHQLWYSIGLACVLITIIFYLIARLSPAEWTVSFGCKYLDKKAKETNHSKSINHFVQTIELRNNFKFIDCAWFVISTMLHQSNELEMR